jgi:hypothetical protein
LNPTRRIVARAIVAVPLGIVVGYAMGKTLAHDAAQAKTLTMNEYIADFDNHRKDLLKGDMPMGAAILIGTLMIVVALAGYELLVLGVDKVLGVVDRRRELGGGA